MSTTRIKFCATNLFDSATVTSLNAGSSNPVSYVQNPLLKKTYRSTGLSNQWLKFDLGSALEIDAFFFFNNNLTSGATITLYGHASDLGNTEASWSGATYKQVISNFDSRTAIILPATNLRWWLLGISDASNPNGYIEIGRVFGGATTGPDENISEDIQVSYLDPSIITETVGGSIYSVSRLPRKDISVNFNDMSSANQIILQTLFDLVGKTQPFVIVFDYDNNPVRLTRYGHFTSDMVFQGTPNLRANINMSFRELR